MHLENHAHQHLNALHTHIVPNRVVQQLVHAHAVKIITMTRVFRLQNVQLKAQRRQLVHRRLSARNRSA